MQIKRKAAENGGGQLKLGLSEDELRCILIDFAEAKLYNAVMVVCSTGNKCIPLGG